MNKIKLMIAAAGVTGWSECEFEWGEAEENGMLLMPENGHGSRWNLGG